VENLLKQAGSVWSLVRVMQATTASFMVAFCLSFDSDGLDGSGFLLSLDIQPVLCFFSFNILAFFFVRSGEISVFSLFDRAMYVNY